VAPPAFALAPAVDPLAVALMGCGYLNPGDVLLAAGVEASIRVAREALIDERRGPPPWVLPDGLPA
jgi:hypothetical protein